MINYIFLTCGSGSGSGAFLDLFLNFLLGIYKPVAYLHTDVIISASQFPEELQRLTTNLRVVDLSGNKMEVLPAAIGNFLQLKSLTLNCNRVGECLVTILVGEHVPCRRW